MNMFGRYLETLCYRRSDGKQRVDFGRAFVQLGAPLIVALILALIGVEVDEGSNAISFISIIAGLMCTVAALLFEARTSIMRRDKTTVENDERSADELFCLCIWLIFVGIVGTIAFLLQTLNTRSVFPGGYIGHTALYALPSSCTSSLLWQPLRRGLFAFTYASLNTRNNALNRI